MTYIPKKGDKFKVFMLVPAFDGDVFVCTSRGRYMKTDKEGKGKLCIDAQRGGEDKANFALNRNDFVFRKIE